MRKTLLAWLIGLSLPCLAQPGYIHGNGDPRNSTPTPNCAASRFYVDDSNQALYMAASGSPCTWTPAGAAGSFDGGTVTNPIVLPADPTLALQAATKQYVDAHAGNSICPLQNATNICLSPSGTGNNYTALNSAITSLSAQGGGGTIWLACGDFPTNGALQDTGGANAVLPMPVIANYASNTVLISIHGCAKPLPSATSGISRLLTTNTTGNFIGGYDSATGGGYPPFTNVWLHLENLEIIVPGNSGIVAVNAGSILYLTHKDILVAADSPTASTNSASVGIIYPSLANGVRLAGEGTLALGGFYTGIIPGEHTHLATLYNANYHNCIKADSGASVGAPATYIGNTFHIDYVWCGPGTDQIVAGSHKTAMVIDVADFESGTGKGVNDPSNLLYGAINFNVPWPTAGYDYCSVPKTGGANLNLTPLWCGKLMSGLIENWKSQDGTGTTLANVADATNSATTTNVTWATATGFTGTVATYNGTTSKAVAASAVPTNFDGTTPFSACVFFNTASLASNQSLVSTLSSATGNPGWRMDLLATSGQIEAYLINNVGTGNYAYTQQNATLLTTGVLHLGCFSYDGSRQALGIKLYLDGSLVGSTVVTNGLTASIASGTPLYVGAEAPADIWFNGAIGRVRVWNRAIASTEVADMWSAGPNHF